MVHVCCLTFSIQCFDSGNFGIYTNDAHAHIAYYYNTYTNTADKLHRTREIERGTEIERDRDRDRESTFTNDVYILL